ncbi:23S rRNA pseudouridine(1911/1915/1917) synthase RluD [Nitrosomonas marina]|uniref:Pseudouridine synthase n=1 Tax=Nitrosomonas marina TaxID=917 RepID=A0A1H8D6K8_9PROT|nr:23S rRNA pseudouridine(1911/1915/1917) synthase RluD [Nitrosomonas marina]SEN02826.1 ribosomal large subunit pseudouridine synthase D [Nitrosomonas marina]
MKPGDHYSAKPLPTSWDRNCESIIDLLIPMNCAGMRLDQALARLLPDWSRSRIQTWIAQERVKLDNQLCTAKQKVWGNEHVLVCPDLTESPTVHSAEAIALNIIHEDDTILVVDKPAGMVVHPGNGNRQGTLLNALLHHAPQLENVPRAGIVHRLDKDTSGLLIIAKTVEAQFQLVRQLQQRTVKRDYLALVLGQVNSNGTVDAPVGRHPVHRTKMAITSRGKTARTHYKLVESLAGCSLLQCSLETGRTHQIRVHMHSIHHPLVGDPVYSGKPRKISAEIGQLLTAFPRQALHAWQLALIHPGNAHEMRWQSELPNDLAALLNQLRHYRP